MALEEGDQKVQKYGSVGGSLITSRGSVSNAVNYVAVSSPKGRITYP